MITQLTGTLIEKDITRIVIDVHGVGYELFIPMSTYDKLPREGDSMSIRTWLYVREDAMVLYGFASKSEKALFTLLINTVSGIGPKLGLNVLSAMPVSVFCDAVVQGNVKQLSQISGIGKRSAERMVVELKDKLGDIAPQATLSGMAGETVAGTAVKAIEDAVGGLTTLGFKADAARKCVSQLATELDDDITAEALIRKALTVLNR
jgi:Holliday junction DNA helicase RuvA